MSQYFQDYMPENSCFGCGANPEGLRIQSYWEGKEALCYWQAEAKHQGWKGILNGGILATVIDCHCMCTAMAAAYAAENRALDTQPVYRYATGTMTIRYLRPVRYHLPICLRATVEEVKLRKTTLSCEVFSEDRIVAKAQVIAIRVYDSSEIVEDSLFYQPLTPAEGN